MTNLLYENDYEKLTSAEADILIMRDIQWGMSKQTYDGLMINVKNEMNIAKANNLKMSNRLFIHSLKTHTLVKRKSAKQKLMILW